VVVATDADLMAMMTADAAVMVAHVLIALAAVVVMIAVVVLRSGRHGQRKGGDRQQRYERFQGGFL
jgi:hypothetical protein